MRKAITISILILVGICFSCTKEKHVFRSKPTVDYYPLRVGNFWEYYGKSIWSKYSIRREIVDFRVIPGSIGVYKVRYFKTYTSYFYPDTVEQKDEWFTYQTFINNEIREFSDLDNPDKYEILLRFPLEVGSSWHEQLQQMDSGYGFSTLIDFVVAIENVTTPIGEFNGCYRIRSSISGIDFTQFEKWFKPQIGFVKYKHMLGPLEYSLVDYKIIR